MNDLPCGCCRGSLRTESSESLTPERISNRPGLKALGYRIGTHPTFFETMKRFPVNRLSKTAFPALSALTTRATDDPSIALLDAAAVMLDVLTFYQERIANEGYLRTASERRSILELARLVGYELRPGVAASVYLAFTLEKDYTVDIPVGTRAQSIPTPGETIESFETAEVLAARAAWNTLQPRMTRPAYMTLGNAPSQEVLYFEGTATNLKPNDPLLLVFGSEEHAQVFHRAEAVKADFAQARTEVRLQTTAFQASAALLSLLDRYLDLAAFRVSGETQMARRVVSFLMTLKRQLGSLRTAGSLRTPSPGITPAELGRMINALLPELREEHAIALEGEYERLAPWVGEMISELEAIEQALSADAKMRKPAAAALGSLRTSAAHQGAAPALSGLEQIIAPLLLPPSIQPRNAQTLARHIPTLYSAQADTLPRLLTAFQPRLKGRLYPAWATTQLAPDTALQTANALRVKAAPFGHNAPLKTILDAKGSAQGQEEWAIDTAAITLQLSSINAGQTLFESLASDQVNALLEIRQGQTSLSSGVVTIAQPEDEFMLTLEEDLTATIRVVYTGDIGTIIRLTTMLQGKAYRVENHAEALAYLIDDEPVHAIEAGDRRLIFHQGMRISLDFTDVSQLTITMVNAPFSSIGQQKRIVTLEAEYNQVLPGSWVAIERADWAHPQAFQVNEVKTVSKAAYGITGKATQLTLNRDWLSANDLTLSTLRQTTIYAQSEALALAEEPIVEPVSGNTIELGQLYDGLEPGRWIIISGERSDIPGTTGIQASELVMVSGVTQGLAQVEDKLLSSGKRDLPGDKTHTTLQLANSLAYAYRRDTVTIYGNVVKATHGETRREVLGSGDASKVFQKFTLKQAPLTFVSAQTPSGVETTLEVRVNDVRWPEVKGLNWLSPNQRGVITRTDDEAKTSVIFGDGEHGARLPTGQETVKAVYRAGIGKPGNVAAGQISLLATRPLGVKSVINPLRASGGADKESRDQARGNAPLKGMALDRLVSVQDYADFARTFGGIGKSAAARLSDGRRSLVHVTVAGVDDIPIDPGSDLYNNLFQALHQFGGDPFLPIQLAVRQVALLIISARVRLLPDWLWEAVEPNIRANMLTQFGFEARDLGQDVFLGEVISAIQAIPGVAYVDVDVLEAVPETTPLEDLAKLAAVLAGTVGGETKAQPKKRIPVCMARSMASTPSVKPDRRIQPAQLAYLTPEIPDTLILTELKP